jgi:hypothetical protein
MSSLADLQPSNNFLEIEGYEKFTPLYTNGDASLPLLRIPSERAIAIRRADGRPLWLGKSRLHPIQPLLLF